MVLIVSIFSSSQIPIFVLLWERSSLVVLRKALSVRQLMTVKCQTQSISNNIISTPCVFYVIYLRKSLCIIMHMPLRSKYQRGVCRTTYPTSSPYVNTTYIPYLLEVACQLVGCSVDSSEIDKMRTCVSATMWGE